VFPADCDSNYDLPSYIYFLVHTKLAPKILWVGDHIEHLNAKLIALNYNTPSLHCVDVLSEVIAPEVIAHLIASDLGIQYDEALNVLRDEAAWEYGGIIDNTPDFIKKADLYIQLLE
jgi:hypothetical protein